MKALMFGWEFPPHILGGLGTASYGLTKGMHNNGDMEITFVIPRPWGDEERGFANIIGVIARTIDCDIIHSHDWLTYPAGIHAKNVTGKPLVIHVHATDFDRSRGNVNPTVFAIEKDGMENADHIITVSELTRRTVIDKYGISPDKVTTVHNAVIPLSEHLLNLPKPENKDKVITFLGRITMQKGPEYFVEAAAKVLKKTKNVRFVMAGSGDMMDAMIKLVAKRGIADRFHFTGFLKGDQVYEMLRASDVYVMPSVSEPFGISPLEAMEMGVPSIISKQSGCAEILDNVIKTDYWDIDAMADAMHSIVTNRALYETLRDNGIREIHEITWEKAGRKVIDIYNKVIADRRN